MTLHFIFVETCSPLSQACQTMMSPFCIDTIKHVLCLDWRCSMVANVTTLGYQRHQHGNRLSLLSTGTFVRAEF